MEYNYSGTESLWYGHWNHLVCRKWKCDVDHPSQSTVVNLGKKQKMCSLWCPWSQVQQDTSGPDNFRTLCCLWRIHNRCTCKWDWTDTLTVSFPLRAKTVWNPLRMNTERCRREEGHNSHPLECRLSAGRLFMQKPRKYCQLDTQASWWCQRTCFYNESAPSQNMFLRALIPNICICGCRFWKWRRSG